MGAIVTSNSDKIFVDFNGLEAVVPSLNGRKKAMFMKSQLVYLTMYDDYLSIYLNGSGEWQLDFTGAKGLPITSVNGEAPTSNSNLYDLLCNL
jgi:hypothetical protein